MRLRDDWHQQWTIISIFRPTNPPRRARSSAGRFICIAEGIFAKKSAGEGNTDPQRKRSQNEITSSTSFPTRPRITAFTTRPSGVSIRSRSLWSRSEDAEQKNRAILSLRPLDVASAALGRVTQSHHSGLPVSVNHGICRPGPGARSHGNAVRDESGVVPNFSSTPALFSGARPAATLELPQLFQINVGSEGNRAVGWSDVLEFVSRWRRLSNCFQDGWT